MANSVNNDCSALLNKLVELQKTNEQWWHCEPHPDTMSGCDHYNIEAVWQERNATYLKARKSGCYRSFQLTPDHLWLTSEQKLQREAYNAARMRYKISNPDQT